MNENTMMTADQQVRLAKRLDGGRQYQIAVLTRTAELYAEGKSMKEARAMARVECVKKPQIVKVGVRKQGDKIVAKMLTAGGKTVEMTLDGTVRIDGKVVA